MIIIASFFNIITDIIIALSVLIILVLLTYTLLELGMKTMNWIENKRLSKPYDFESDITLFRWSEGIEMEERFLYKILNEKIGEDPITSLNLIKKKIKNACSGDVGKLKLLKIYLERSMSENVNNNVWSIIIGIVVAALTTMITNLTSDSKFINYIHQFITSNDNNGEILDVTNVINYATYLLIFIMFIIYTSNILTRDKRRLLLLNKIIDLAITEIEFKINKTK